MIDAISTEIEMVAASDYLQREPVETIYFGGGTPSLLDEMELKQLFTGLQNRFTISTNAEITLEANPDDINPEQLTLWRRLGVNRLSIGVQSFFDEDLRFMNRAHDAGQAIQCLQEAKKAGFDNLSIDLIYGVPGMSDEKWEKNIDIAIGENIPHLSCYALTVEPSTALDIMIKKHRAPDVDPELQARQFLILINKLQAAGYEHYEISNFSLPGKRSRHNTSYWQGKTYAGIGPSAHSFNRISRQWNVANNAIYMQTVEEGKRPFEIESLTLVQQKNEYIMTALRTMEGIDLDIVEDRFGHEEVQRLISLIQPEVSSKKAIVNQQHIILTSTGKLFADGIASDLFDEESTVSTPA